MCVLLILFRIRDINYSSQMFFIDNTIKIYNLILILRCTRSVIKERFFFTSNKKRRLNGEERIDNNTQHFTKVLYIYILFFLR